jgi:hypothetical protein
MEIYFAENHFFAQFAWPVEGASVLQPLKLVDFNRPAAVLKAMIVECKLVQFVLLSVGKTWQQ